MEKDPNSQIWTACHECDAIVYRAPVPVRHKALCRQCGAFLYRQVPNGVENGLALSLAALMLFILANAFPFLSLEIHGRAVENHFLSGAFRLYHLGMGEVGLLVMLTSFVFPLLLITGTLYLLLSMYLGKQPWQAGRVYRMITALRPWALVSVFMLGVLISFVKLLDMAEVIPGVALYAFVGLMVTLAASNARMDPSVIWPPKAAMPEKPRNPLSGTARQNHLVSCHTCGLLVSGSHGRCPRCTARLHSRKPRSLERTLALVLASALLFIPANVYPVMTVIQFGRGFPSTILGGVVHLIEGGMWGLAMIIFFASIVVPVLKLAILSLLLLSVRRKTLFRPKDRTRLFRVTEVVGAWSMVDIYVVAILAGLVNLGALSTVRPGIGVAFFGAVVVITMFAAESFDPRLIWDACERNS